MNKDSTNIQNFETLLKSLPEKPGVYQYFDENKKLIYVGKAKNLKKRVSSYFNHDNSLNGKTYVLVKKIADIQYIVVETELDALLLENNLIKKYQPRYNVLLKDDKTYPWICIKKERFPRIFPTRNIIKDGSQYFGPYASVRMMNTLLELIKQLYPLRTCNFNLTEANVLNYKFKVCLEYHINNCKGPCENLQTVEDYNQNISEIKDIIKGNISNVSKQLKDIMLKYSEEYKFEKAQFVKEKLELLNKYQSKSLVVNQMISNIDVFSLISEEKSAFVNYIKIINGAIIQSHTVEIIKKLDETKEELLILSIIDFRQRFESTSKEILIPFPIDIEIPKITFTIPQKGDKKQLLELSERNAKYYQLDKQKQKDLVDPERHSKRILNQVMSDLRLKEIPNHIECFDNSNIQGEFAVSSMVVFKNAKPDKNEYRHFNIKTVEGANDFATMEEVVFRRYNRLIEENKTLPQLIIVDGGKGQLSSALKSLEKLNLRGKISIIGIAKKLEEIYFPEDSIPLYIDKKSETLKLIQRMRDEAHRFGITHHRKRREKSLIKTELTDIKGIGEETSKILLTHFRSVIKIKKASFEELTSIIGKAKADIVTNYFKNKK